MVRKGASSTQRRAQISLRRAKLPACSLPWRLTTVQLSIIFSTGTQNNLAQGSLKERLPPGCGAKKRTVSGKCWTAIRPAMVMSGCLVVAGGGAFVERAALYRHRQRVAEDVSRGGGRCLGWVPCLPGKVGFAEDNSWRLTPATCRRRWRSISPALARRVTTLRETNQRLLLETAPKGFFARLGGAMRKTKAGS